VRAYVEANAPDLTSVDAFGWRNIVQEAPPVIAGALSNSIVAVGSRFASLPGALRHTVTIRLFASQLDQSLDAPQLSAKVSLPRIGLKRLGVTYRGASSADEQLLQSYRDSGATSLPAYLIRVVPQLTLDGEPLAEGVATTMGSGQYWDASLSAPGAASTPASFPGGVAGDELVFSVNGGGFEGQAVLIRMFSAPTQSAAENLHLVGLNYWAAHDRSDQAIASALDVRTIRLPSVALVRASLTPRYFLGIARQASYTGRQLDARRVSLAAVGPDATTVSGFLVQAGLTGSQWEASVFNMTFGGTQGANVSTTEYLTYAALRGIPIHTVNRQNVDKVLGSLQVSSSVREDVSNAARAGFTVIVPQREVQVLGRSGTGYAIIDPQTGVGAYLVDGGLNGGVQPACGASAKPPFETVNPSLAFMGPLAVGTEKAVEAQVAKEIEKRAAVSVARALLPRLLTAITARIVGSSITIAVAPLILNPVAAVAISLAIIMLMHMVQMALLEEEVEVGDLTRVDTEAQADRQCQVKTEDPPPKCGEAQGPEKGGDPIHINCQRAHTSIPGFEWVLTHPDPAFPPPNPKSYDTVQGRTVCDVKTDACRPGSPNGFCGSEFLQMLMRNDLKQQQALATECGYSFCAIVGDPQVAEIVQSWGIAVELDETPGLCRQP